MKKAILLTAVALLSFFNSSAQSDTIVFRNSNNYELGVAIGDDYYPFTHISENSMKLYTNNGYTVKQPTQYLLNMYHAGEFSIKSEKQKQRIKKRNKRTRGDYLRLAGIYKNAAIGIQSGGALLSAMQINQEEYDMAAATTIVSTILSVGLNIAGNTALIKAGDAK